MKIQKIVRRVALATVATLVATTALAQQVTVSQIFGYHGNGGEFNVTPIVGSGYGSSVVVSNGFETFCLSRTANITIPGLYYYSVDSTGIYQPDNLPITKGVAWLYSQFATGILGGYNYIDTSGTNVGGRSDTAVQLQLAIWTLEGTYGYPNVPPQTSLEADLALNPFLNEVATTFGGGTNGLLVAMSNSNPGDYHVGALNLNFTNQDGSIGTNAQPMLVLLTPAAIGDFVWEDKNTNGVQDTGEPGIPGAKVTLTDCNGSSVVDFNGNPVAPYITLANGFYTFTNLSPGTYKVTVTLPSGFVFSQSFQGGDVAKDSNVNPATGISDCRTLVSGQYDDTVDAGASKLPPASIGDFIWEDKNTNGLQDASEPGIAGATVTLTDCSGTPVTDINGNLVNSVITGTNGFYFFGNLNPGQYKIIVTLPTGYLFTLSFQGANVAKDSNVNPATGISDCRTLVAGQYDNTVDAGAYKPVVCKASLCGDIFADCDGSGDLSNGDVGLKSVLVKLLNSAGTVVGSTTTDTNGSYCFNGLNAGSYTVSVTPPAGYKETAASTTYHWKDRYARNCWSENDGNVHCINNGTECWVDNNNCLNWKDSCGRDCWQDKYGKCYYRTCTYTSCNASTNNNTMCVTLTNCQNKFNVNFAYTGTTPKLAVCVSGPSWAKCGQTITYTCAVTNTGNVCFKGGTICHNVGNCGSWGWTGSVCSYNATCPPLSPGQSCVVTQKCTLNWWNTGSLKCQSSVSCSQSGGYTSGQSACTTQVTW